MSEPSLGSRPVRRRVLLFSVAGAVAVAGIVAISLVAAGVFSSPATARLSAAGAARHDATVTRQVPAPGGTRVLFYRPWTPTGLARGIRAAATVRGYCWTGSLAAGTRADAYRCFVGNEIFDPCFADRYARAGYGVVACPYPGPRAVTVIKLARRLPALPHPPPGPPRQWLLVLDGGLRCYVNTGASFVTHGLRLSYGCQAGYLYGSPRSGHPWTILYQRRLGAPLTRVAVAEAYE